MQDVRKSVFRIKLLENKMMLAACTVGFLLQAAVTKIPFLTAAFGTVTLSWQEWVRLTILAAFPLLAHELLVLFDGEPAEGKREAARVWKPLARR